MKQRIFGLLLTLLMLPGLLIVPGSEALAAETPEAPEAAQQAEPLPEGAGEAPAGPAAEPAGASLPAAAPLAEGEAPAGLVYEGGVYKLAGAGTSTRARSAAAPQAGVLDLQGAQLTLAGNEQTALHLEGADGLTIRGLRITLSEAPAAESAAAQPEAAAEAPAAPAEAPSSEAPAAPAEAQPEASEAQGAPEADALAGSPAVAGAALTALAGPLARAADALLPVDSTAAVPADSTAAPEDPAASLPPAEGGQSEADASEAATGSLPASAPPASEAPADSSAPPADAAPSEAPASQPEAGEEAPATPEAENLPAGSEAAASAQEDAPEAEPENSNPRSEAPEGAALLITGCHNLVLEDVVIEGAANLAVQVDAASSGITLRRLTLEGSGDGVVLSGADGQATLSDSILQTGGTALRAEGPVHLENNTLAGAVGLTLASEDAVVQNNRISGGTAALTAEGAQNNLIAFNELSGGVLTLAGSPGAVLLGNHVDVPLVVEGGAGAVLADNVLAAGAEVRGVENALVTGNRKPDGSLADVALTAGSTARGDNGEAQPAVGAQGLAPAYMPQGEVKTKVEGQDVDEYIQDRLISGAKVIIPPGIYTVPEPIYLSRISDATLYAYDVHFIFKQFPSRAFALTNCTNVSLKGFSMDYAEATHCQGTVASIRSDGVVRFKPDAGYQSKLMNSDYFPTLAGQVFAAGAATPYADIGFSKAYNNGDGTYNLTGPTMSMKAGDRLVIRAKFTHTNYMTGCSSILFEDVSVYAGSGFAFYEQNGELGMTLNRVTVSPNVPAHLPQGPQATARLVSTCDAAHSAGMRRGPQILGCRFTAMTDDGVNIRGEYAPALSYDAATGQLSYTKNAMMAFRPGDTVVLYTADGRLLLECAAASATADVGSTSYVTLSAPLAYEPGNTLVGNASASGPGFLIQNTTVENNRSRGLLIQAPYGLIQGCTLSGNGMSSLLIQPQAKQYKHNGTVGGIQVFTTSFIGGGYYGSSELYSPITIATEETANKDTAYQRQRSVHIYGNAFTDRYTRYAINLSNAQGITVEANTFGTQRSDKTAPALHADGVTGIAINGNIFPGTAKPRMRLNGNTVTGASGADITKDSWYYETEKVVMNMLAKTLPKKGAKVQLKLTYTPKAAKDYNKAKWTTSNKKVATVTQKGKVTARGNGRCKITATTSDGKKVVCNILVGGTPVKSVTLSKRSLTLKPKKSARLKAGVNPENASNKRIVWQSSNPAIAKVNASGKVTAVAKGTCKITAISRDGGKKRVCTVRVR